MSSDINIVTGKAVLYAAKTIKQQNANREILTLLLQNSSSLLDVLCLPLAQVVDTEFSFISLGIALVKSLREITQREPTLKDSVLILSQVAYLESVKEILSLYPSVDWDANFTNIELVKKLLQKLNDWQLNDENARQSIDCFHESELAKLFNQILYARLIAKNITKYQAYLLTQRIVRNTHRYLVKTWIELGNSSKNLMYPSWGDCFQEQQKIQSIREYLQTNIATKPLEKVFNESFSFRDIYIPLQAKPIHQNLEVLDLETWAKKILLNPDNLEKVMFIQGDPGTGKSVFCRILADWVWHHLHPIWIPILICLRDIDWKLDLEDTLKTELNFNFSQSDKNWISDKNTRFLFILDGFDELNFNIESRNNLNLEIFIQQVAEFQQKCKNYSDMGHRVLITGRTVALKDIHHLPQNLERVEILLMDEKLQNKWLQKWKSLPDNQGKNGDIGEFLQSDKCPVEVQKLAQEPLVLYLLAAMYRDEKLSLDKLEKANQKNAKVLLYQEVVNWVLNKNISQIDEMNLNEQIIPQKPQDLKHLLTEMAVCIVQSGGEFASMSMVEEQLQENETEKTLIIQAKAKLGAVFNIRHSEKQEKKIEFFHQSFTEFLFSDRLKIHCKLWTQYYDGENGKVLITSSQQMNWQIYNLLGFGRLTPEIIEYLIGLLIEIPNFEWEQLFRRLETFYGQWCQGKFIDSAQETLSQKKLQQLQKHGIQELGQRQVDLYTGLNVMILLLELHRYGQMRDDLKQKIVFYPSGKAEKEGHLTSQLLRIINYSYGIELEIFNRVVGKFLSYANLSHANLSHANLNFVDLNQAYLNKANFADAELSGANLSYAYLSAASLTRTNLRSANLSSANLNNANLSHANLSYANLSSAFLIDANLSRTDIIAANLSFANLRNANISSANMSKSNISSAKLEGANLSDTNLSNTNFSHANLIGANLNRTNLSGATLNHADLRGAKLVGVNFTNTNLENVVWNPEMKLVDAQGLHSVVNMPSELREYLQLN